MKKKLSKFFSYFLLAVMTSSLAVSNVNAEVESRATDYDKSFSYNGAVQTYIVPASGYYKLEVWGASGGDAMLAHAWLTSGEARNVTAYGGKGGYSVGYKYLEAGQKLYVCVGQEGRQGWDRDEEFGEHSYPTEDPNISSYRAYNGGGYGWNQSGNGSVSGGGGATHIALGTNRGTLANYTNNKSEVLIVAGGGGGGLWQGGEIMGDGNIYDVPYRGGSGGGVTGGTGEWTYEFPYGPGAGGTQNGPGKAPNQVNGPAGSFGKGGDGAARASGGGGGWYGGGGGQEDGAGGGGSGYIGGCVTTLTYNGQTYKSQTVTSTHTGNGKAIITYLGPIYYRQTVQIRYENADGTFTEYEDEVVEDYAVDSIFTWTREADSTYQEASVSYTVTEEKTTQITVYRQQYMLTLEKGTGIDTVSGEGEYRAGQTVTIDAEVMEGYKFSGWSDSETLTETESTYEFEMPTNDLSYTAIAVPIEYSIAYYLDGGTDEGKNPKSYTVESENIVLKPPTKDGYSFLGWSESNGSAYQESITIQKGSTGDKAYWANWEENELEGGLEDNNDQGNEPDGEPEDESEDEGSILPLPTRNPPHTPKLPATIPVDDGLGDGDEEAEIEEPELTPMPSNSPSPEPVIKEVVDMPLDNAGNSNSNRNNYSFGKIAATAAGAGGTGGGMIFFVFFWFFRKCKIYDAQTEELIGKSIIRKDRKGMFWIKISDAVCDMAGTKIYIVFGKNFVRSNPEKPLKISAHGKEFYRQVQEKVDIKI